MNAFFNTRTRNTFFDGLPFPTLHRHAFRSCHRSHDGVASIAIACFGVSFVRGVTDVAIASLVTWLANCVTNVAVASVIDRSANRIRACSVAGFVNRLSNRLRTSPIAGLVVRNFYRVADISVASLVARLADRVALITIASIVNSTRASDGSFLDAGVINCLTFIVSFCTPDRLANSLVRRSTIHACFAIIPTRIARPLRTTTKTTASAE